MTNYDAFPEMNAQRFIQAIQKDVESAPAGQMPPDDLRELYAASWYMVVDHLERTTDWTSIYDPMERVEEIVTSIFSVYGQTDTTEQGYNFAMFWKAAEGVAHSYVMESLFGHAEVDRDYEDERLLARIHELIGMLVADPVEAEKLSVYTLNFISVLYYARLRGFFDPATTTTTALYTIRRAIEGDPRATWDQQT
jgi:hypothetical protein